MNKKNALTVVQTQRKSGANTGANLPNRGGTPTEVQGPYIPYKEVESSPTAPQHTQLAPAALTAAAQVLVLLFKCVTLGAVNITGSIDQYLLLQEKRRTWRQTSREAAAENYGRGQQTGQVQSQTSRQCRTDIVRPNVQQHRQGHVTIVHNYFISNDK